MNEFSPAQLRFLADAVAAPHSPAGESCNKVARRLRKKAADMDAAAAEPSAGPGHSGPGLEPCPFCGGEGRIVAADEAGPSAYVVCCRKCQASSPVVYALKESAEPKLIEAWNRRC